MTEQMLGIMIPLTTVFMALLIPIVYAIVDYRRRRDIVEAHHKERLAAIERGMDIAALPESFYNPYQRRPRTLLWGLIWFLVGIALMIALGRVAGEDVMYFGLIPTGVGVALLLYYAIEGRKESRADSKPAVTAEAVVRR